jgi:hypothetical protein
MAELIDIPRCGLVTSYGDTVLQCIRSKSHTYKCGAYLDGRWVIFDGLEKVAAPVVYEAKVCK